MKKIVIKEIILRFRARDIKDFELVRRGMKTVETRAATTRYKNIQKGDVLIIMCGEKRIVKTVKHARHFKSIAAMVKTIPFKKIMPAAQYVAEMKKVYDGYPAYREKISRFGIVAFEI